MSLRSLDARTGRVIVQAWVGSRGLICVVALLLAIVEGRSMLDMVNNWDAVHYGELARDGYLSQQSGILMAFFPGLPGLLRLGLVIGLPAQVSGVIVSLVCSLIAAIALGRLGGPWAAIAWLFAPTAVFTTVPYTESLFCAAAFWAWERARSDRWLPASLLAAIACTVRVSGLFLVGALFVMIVVNHRISWSQRLRRASLLIIPVGVLLGFAGYLYSLTGDWTAWYTAETTGWAIRGLTWPWESLRHALDAAKPGAFPDHPEWLGVFRAEIVSMAIGLLVTGWCLAKRRWAEASWMGIQVLAFSLSYWFMSVNRAVLLWFPFWIMLAEWGTARPKRRVLRVLHRGLITGWFIVSTALMLWWSWLYFTGRWAS